MNSAILIKMTSVHGNLSKIKITDFLEFWVNNLQKPIDFHILWDIDIKFMKAAVK